MSKKTRNILLEFLIYSVLFGLSIGVFPICNFYYLGDNDEMLTEPQYLNDIAILYALPLFFILVMIGFLSLKRAVIIVLNTVVIVLTLLLFLFIQLSFAWWGASPFHPDLQAGYLLSHIFLFVLIIRTFILLGSLSQVKLSKTVQVIAFVLAVSIPVLFITYITIGYNEAMNQPIMRSQWIGVERGRLVNTESWDYTEDCDAYVSKYYSKDTLKTEEYRLDSVGFTFFDDESNIQQRFTRKAKNGKLDIEKILEEND
jgi:hypothetical protein